MPNSTADKPTHKPTHKPLLDYFENINSNLKDFPDKSFFRMDIEEIFGAFRRGINMPAMSVESPEGEATKSSPSNNFIGRTFAFNIMAMPKKGDFEEQNRIIDQCEQIGWKIIARMRFDNTDPKSLIYNKFKVSSVRFHKIGPLFNEELYGYRFTGEIGSSESLQVNKDDWEDLDRDCAV